MESTLKKQRWNEPSYIYYVHRGLGMYRSVGLSMPKTLFGISVCAPPYKHVGTLNPCNPWVWGAFLLGDRFSLHKANDWWSVLTHKSQSRHSIATRKNC